MSNWTPESVLALAPDSSSASAGRSLSSASKWLSFARNQTAIWGECQGSGRLPYQTRVDLSDGTSKCSCPSRKFPCKHGLGLLLLYAAKPDGFSSADPPSWVAEWLEGRSKRAESKAAKDSEPKEVDLAAQAKRTAAREKKVNAGIKELDLWMRDLLRGGLAQAPGKPYKFWEDMAARLVDAQAPGLARMVRELSESTSGDGWQDELLEKLGRIHLISQGYSRLESLPEATQADLRSAIGFNQPQEEIQALPGVAGTWLVMGQAVVQEEKLRARRTWLCLENTERYALVLEFAFGSSGFSAPLTLGNGWHGELAFYPSAYPMRAVLKSGSNLPEYGLVSFLGNTASQLMDQYASVIAGNPWLERIPTTLSATLEPFGPTHHWTLRATDGTQFKLHPSFNYHLALLGGSGGNALNFFGEWDGQHFLPLRVYSPQEDLLLDYPHREG